MTRIFIFISIFIASVNFTFAGNSVFIINKKAFHTLADIPLNLSAKDKRSNIQLRPKFTVISVGGGNIIPLKETDGRFMVTVKSGESYKILAELETWAKELGFQKCILETGNNQPEAIRLYQKCNYKIIPNYGQYEGVETSFCFEKVIG